MSHVFISYSTPDRADAAELAAMLKDNGYEVWWDRELVVGEQYANVIAKALADSEAAIVLWSDSSIESRWVSGEAETAASAGKLLPVRADHFDPSRLPIGFKSLHTVALSDTRGIISGLEKLKATRSGRQQSAIERFLARQQRRGNRIVGWFNWWRAIATAIVLAIAGYLYAEYSSWTSIATSPDASDFERHAAIFPVGLFRSKVSARLAGQEQWDKIKLSRKSEDFAAFIKAFPDSLYAPLAAVRANRLRAITVGEYKSVIPASSDRAVSSDELVTMNCEQLWTARNEIFYRAGRCFTSQDGIAVFKTDKDCPYSSCAVVRSINTVIDHQIMTPIEATNVDTILTAERKLGCRLPNAVGLCAPLPKK